MKSKKSIYVLLPLVIIIWGAIVYQIFDYSTPESAIVPAEDFSVKPIVQKPKDSISIKINQRDPFSGKMVDDAAKRPIGKQSRRTPKIKEELIWPQIKYKGIVSDVKDKIKVYMVIIDGKTHLMKKGETEEEIVLKDGDREMIYLNYNGDSKVVFIQ
jgi:hypothetical protein